ncbi:MAG: hypothetical protein EBU66_15690 [Bacteroidetes bacterium]|jgi:hypothetical protein|nr:hypothetical protein [Bacteroidota bacterium]
MPCFIAGDMKALTYKQMIQYSLAQNTFLRINNYNIAIKTKRQTGNTTASYYVFKEGEQMLYKQGQFLLTQNDPGNAALYQSVVKV